MSEYDLQRGTYRRVYSGMIWGKRINSVSLEAEAWFWRLNAIADDFGNLPGDPARLHKETSGRRDVASKAVRGWIDELVHARLLVSYEAEGEPHLHIVGFGLLQPASTKNGRRVRRYPESPMDRAECGEPGESKVNPENPRDSGESKRFQENPGNPVASGSVLGSESSSPPPTREKPKAAAAMASPGGMKPPEGRRAVFEAMVLAGVSERKAVELSADPHVRTEDVRRISDRRKQAGKVADGSLVAEIQTAAAQYRIRAERKAKIAGGAA